MSESQSYANHRRFDPLMHFVVLPVLLIMNRPVFLGPMVEGIHAAAPVPRRS